MIGTKEILKRSKEDDLLMNLSERELNNPEGVGIDLRLGKVYTKLDAGFLGITERKTPNVKLVASFDPDEKKSFVIKPGEHVLVETVEKVNMPDDLVATIIPRTTLYRCGVNIHTGLCNPGYSGTLTFAMQNVGDHDFKIEMGARIVNILFHPIKGELHRTYEGQWQGGRVTTAGEIEKQI